MLSPLRSCTSTIDTILREPSSSRLAWMIRSIAAVISARMTGNVRLGSAIVVIFSRRASVSRGLLAWIVATIPSNIFFMVRDFRFASDGIASTGAHLVYVSRSELGAMNWLEKHTDHRERVLCHPWTLGVRIPYESGNSVYVGHWSETIDFADKFRLARQFFAGPASEPWRNQFLADVGCQYIVTYTDPEQARGIWGGREDTEALAVYLSRFEKVYSNSDLAIYRVSPKRGEAWHPRGETRCLTGRDTSCAYAGIVGKCGVEQEDSLSGTYC